MGNPITRVIRAAGSTVAKTALDVVDKLTTSEAERNEIKLKLLNAEREFLIAVSEHEAKIAEERAKVIVAEAQSESWAARNWRPFLMFGISALLLYTYLIVPLLSGVLPIQAATLPGELWTLLEVGVGGYIVGRSVEKIAPTLRDGLAARK